MVRRDRLATYVLSVALAGVAGVASADEGTPTAGPEAVPALTTSAPESLSTLFQGAARRAAAAPAVTSDHNFGVGLRVGGYSFGIGGTLRYFVSGPWGIQAEISRYGLGVPGFDYHSTLINGEVLYRFNEIKLEAPLKLQPYGGAGIGIIRTSTADVTVPGLGTIVPGASNTSSGAIITGGVEVTFERVPKLGLSGAFEWPFVADFGTIVTAGPAGLIAAHWYFK